MRILSSARRSLIAGVMAGLMVSGFGGQALAYPTPWSVAVPNVPQLQTNWCWAGTGVSILQYYNKFVTQCTFVGYVKGTSPNCPNVTAFDSEVKSGLAHWGVSSTLTTSSLGFTTIISEIYTNNRPIYAGWTWNTGGGHAVVLDGYDDDTIDWVEYMDPWDGTHHASTYTWFRGGSGSGSDHVWDGTLYRMSSK